MALTECGKGHIYDSNQYSACPYCNGRTNVINFGGGSGESTIAPDMGAGGDSIGRTSGGFSDVGRTVAEINPNFSTGETERTYSPDFMRKRSEEENKTVGVFKQKHNFDPVVGWLVCIDGPEKGKDYHLWARINTIGRDDKMDVCIKNDYTISKENHARIAYDPKHNNFHLAPADSTNNIYVNDEPIYTPVRISAYDVIELGESKMLFVPFCTDRFTWTDGLTQEN